MGALLSLKKEALAVLPSGSPALSSPPLSCKTAASSGTTRRPWVGQCLPESLMRSVEEQTDIHGTFPVPAWKMACLLGWGWLSRGLAQGLLRGTEIGQSQQDDSVGKVPWNWGSSLSYKDRTFSPKCQRHAALNVDYSNHPPPPRPFVAFAKKQRVVNTRFWTGASPQKTQI